jgi:hypothetical protein
MVELCGYPYFEVEIHQNGALREASDLARATAFASDNGITDLVVISHGWNNHKQEARDLYEGLFDSVRAVSVSGAVDLGARKIGVVGVVWPSKKFTDEDLVPRVRAASIVGDQSKDIVGECLDSLASALSDLGANETIKVVRAAIGDLDHSAAARELFANTVRDLLPQEHATNDDGSDRFFEVDAQELFDRLQAPFFPQALAGAGGAAGGATGGVTGEAASLGDWFNGAKAAARRILNYATYYTMKARASVVGAGGVCEFLAAVMEGAPETKIHLVGHSFGGRVVTAASKALGDKEKPKPSSMSLLQAAFSHNGFAKNFRHGKDGCFRPVMQDSLVAGPVIVTHTHNDTANAIAYPLASRLAGQDAAAVGGAGDPFGAIGANGALHTPEAITGALLPVGAPGYSFLAGHLYNLEADRYIKDHGDIGGREVAYALLTAIGST